MGGEEYFVVRTERGAGVATLQAQQIEGDGAKTQVVLSKNGDVWHFDKLELAGNNASYQFVTK